MRAAGSVSRVTELSYSEVRLRGGSLGVFLLLTFPGLSWRSKAPLTSALWTLAALALDPHGTLTTPKHGLPPNSSHDALCHHPKAGEREEARVP